MPDFDLVVRNGTVVTADSKSECDVGVIGGRIAALGRDLPAGREEIDAGGKLVLPGGIETHCHIEQMSSAGMMNADDFHSGTVSAAFGGNTTIVPFACQNRGEDLGAVVRDYHARAAEKAVIDYGFHLIITDPTDQAMGQDLPALVRSGITSFKVFMTYDLMKIDDGQFLDVLAVARREGALTMVHAENHDMIAWMSRRLLEKGHRAPRYHAMSHPKVSEGEAAYRAIALARLADAPLFVVHVSTEEAMETIRRAQGQGLKVYAETCPQYLFLTAKALDLDGIDGAMQMCSPPPRDEASQEAMWRGLQNGTFQCFSSDHAPFRFDESGKLAKGRTASFKEIANGIPGIELRMPLLFSEGVLTGRIDIHRFVALTSTNAARIFGLFPRKGTIAVGADADLAVWDPELEVDVTWDDLHDNVGYTPYEGRRVTGWPVTVINRGRLVVHERNLHVERGSGTFLARDIPESARPLGRVESEMDPARNFGADLF